MGKKTTTTENVKASVDASVKATIVATVKSIQVYSTDDGVRYRVNLDKEFDGFVIKDDNYVPAKVNYIAFGRSVLIAQVINLVAGVDVLYTKKKETAIMTGNDNGFGAAELQVILRGATVTIERTRFNAGDEYTDLDGEIQIHEYDGYRTDIVDIAVSKAVQKKLDEVAFSVLAI